MELVGFQFMRERSPYWILRIADKFQGINLLLMGLRSAELKIIAKVKYSEYVRENGLAFPQIAKRSCRVAANTPKYTKHEVGRRLLYRQAERAGNS